MSVVAIDGALATGGCFHCGEALPMRPVALEVDGADREFCCNGCAGAARWIRDARLLSLIHI